jgi:hypothetical protein
MADSAAHLAAAALAGWAAVVSAAVGWEAAPGAPAAGAARAARVARAARAAATVAGYQAAAADWGVDLGARGLMAVAAAVTWLVN